MRARPHPLQPQTATVAESPHRPPTRSRHALRGILLFHLGPRAYQLKQQPCAPMLYSWCDLFLPSLRCGPILFSGPPSPGLAVAGPHQHPWPYVRPSPRRANTFYRRDKGRTTAAKLEACVYRDRLHMLAIPQGCVRCIALLLAFCGKPALYVRSLYLLVRCSCAAVVTIYIILPPTS